MIKNLGCRVRDLEVLDPRGKQLANQCEKIDPFIS